MILRLGHALLHKDAHRKYQKRVGHKRKIAQISQPHKKGSKWWWVAYFRLYPLYPLYPLVAARVKGQHIVQVVDQVWRNDGRLTVPTQSNLWSLKRISLKLRLKHINYNYIILYKYIGELIPISYNFHTCHGQNMVYIIWVMVIHLILGILMLRI